MDIQSTMTVTFQIERNELFVSAHIQCPNNLKKELLFCLNKDLAISSVEGNHINCENVGDAEIPFCPPCQKIKLKSKYPITEVSIQYHGKVQFDLECRKNWYNYICDEFISLSSYSAWIPCEISTHIDIDKVIFKNSKDWLVIKGIYNAEDGSWEYGNHGFDKYNIVAYNRNSLQIVSNDFINIYFTDTSILPQTRVANSIYNDILNFYTNDLFAEKDIPILDVACAYPYITIGGGYRRKDFMWCTSFGDNETEISWLFAHETAHVWCNGADCNSWEDWLNETTAEWSALLYALKNNNSKLFNFLIKPKIQFSKSLPPIKTPDGSRPKGVHEKGTALFYRVYQKFGYEAMKKIINCFVNLDTKNTAEFLSSLREIGLVDISDMIHNNLCI